MRAIGTRSNSRLKADHFLAIDDGKLLFDVQDSKIAKGRLGLWSSNDSQARFDNLTLTLPLPARAVVKLAARLAVRRELQALRPPPPPPP